MIFIAFVGNLIFGYEKDAVTIEEIEKTLNTETLNTYQAAQDKVDEKFENCIQYILYALEDGQYVCASCPPTIPFVTLKKGEIWYIGHTCQEGGERHSQAFQKKHGVWMFTNFVGNKESCHKVELKLLRACLNFAFESTASKYCSERGRRREHSRSYVTDAQRSAEQYLPLAGRSVKFKQALRGYQYLPESVKPEVKLILPP